MFLKYFFTQPGTRTGANYDRRLSTGPSNINNAAPVAENMYECIENDNQVRTTIERWQ